MMRLPAALKWLILGGSAWLIWRVPIVARDLSMLGRAAPPAITADAGRTVAGSDAAFRPDDAESTFLDASTVATPQPMHARHPWYPVTAEDALVTLSSPPSTIQSVNTPPEAVLAESPGALLAQQGYARLRAGDRKAAAALLGRALATAPDDPRASAWAADRRTLTRRWSGDAYLLARRGGTPALLGATPTLGGSQFGARLGYDFNPHSDQRITLAGRVYQPLARQSGRSRAAQAVAAIELRPARALPVTFAIERYIAAGELARDAWAVRMSGGVDHFSIARGVTASFYAQTGMIGARSRDAYADGWVRTSTPVAHVRGIAINAGGGIWGGAQPGASRLDVGPTLEIRGQIGGARMTGTIDYRIRAAGNARPGNGPAVTVQAGF